MPHAVQQLRLSDVLPAGHAACLLPSGAPRKGSAIWLVLASLENAILILFGYPAARIDGEEHHA